MSRIIISILLICAPVYAEAQTNFVKNGDFERYDTCPYQADNIVLAKFWRPPVDSSFIGAGEYYNACSSGSGDMSTDVPESVNFYQYAHSGGGLIGLHLYYDKTSPPPPGLPFNYRDYAQVRLYNTLSAGKTYCVSFWVNKAESYCYAHNKIGAYLDDGNINTAVDSAGKEITSLIPQVYTNTIVKDTQSWVKIEGSFVATGNESVITIGNFFPNAALDTSSADCLPGGSQRYSYYIFDDVSVVPIDSKANAGPDRWVELTKSIQIGPVEDSTARGMDCKWYHNGLLIDSGNVISVAANLVKYAVDTYIVVQDVCGNITRDTMLLHTVGLGITEKAKAGAAAYRLYPNPSSGSFFIQTPDTQKLLLSLFDLQGRRIYTESIQTSLHPTAVSLTLVKGTYLLWLQDKDGNRYRERLQIE